ncbi:MAG: hypothetical protein H6828_09955 [Planctomycetes bacterium]|nr:hypothetical protein [Planctomycetota bacterium]
MRHLAPLALVLALPFVQERVSKKAPTFEELHPAIASAYAEGRYGLAMNKTRELLAVLSPKWTESILAALPAAPEGYEIVPQKKPAGGSAMANGALAAMAASVGTVVEQKYKGDGDTLQVTVTADSPMAQMFAMWITNPALLGEGAEAVKYGAYDAILKQEGQGWSLQILIGSSLVEAKGRKATDELLLKLFDQQAVDKLAKELVF